MAATNKCLAQSNKSRTSFEATKNLLALTAAPPPLLDGVNLQYAPSIGPKEQIDVASLQTTELDAMENCRVRDRRWLGKAVVLIASTAAIVVFGMILAAMSSLP